MNLSDLLGWILAYNLGKEAGKQEATLTPPEPTQTPLAQSLDELGQMIKDRVKEDE